MASVGISNFSIPSLGEIITIVESNEVDSEVSSMANARMSIRKAGSDKVIAVATSDCVGE